MDRALYRRVGGRGLALLALLPLLFGGGAVPSAQPPALTLIMGGDVMLGRGVAQGLAGEWTAALAELAPTLPAGPGRAIFLANLESPLTGAPVVRGRYDLRAPPAAAAALAAGGLDAVSLANNHALDAGMAGREETIAALDQAGIAAWLPGAPIAGPAYQGLAFDDSVVPLDLDAAAAQVAAAVASGAPVIVSIHWGGEYQAAPGLRQRAVAAALAAAGADVIAGHGPHVLQPVEWVGETLVAYSLGNLLFDQPYPLDCRRAALLQVTVQEGRAVAVEALPTVSERGRTRPAGPEEAAWVMARLGEAVQPWR